MSACTRAANPEQSGPCAVCGRVDSRLGLIWVGPLEIDPQQARRAGADWSAADAGDDVSARVDGLLASTDPGELTEKRRVMARDGSTLVVYVSDSGDPMLVVTTGPPLPSLLMHTVIRMLTELAEDVPEPRSLEQAA